jgi:hypothetical protein
VVSKTQSSESEITGRDRHRLLTQKKCEMSQRQTAQLST